MVVLVTLLAAVMAQSSSAQNERVVGHVYKCEATLELSGGKLSAIRTLDADQKQMSESDTASWNPEKYEGLSASWSVAYGRENLKVSQIPASVRFFSWSKMRLPRVTLWTLRHSNGIAQDELTLPMTTDAEPKLGSAQLPLRALMAYADTHDAIEWTVSDPKMKPDGTRAVYTQGRINLGGLREAYTSLTRLDDILGELALSPEKKCKLTPIYYNEDAEI